jgi:hypothetical protein
MPPHNPAGQVALYLVATPPTISPCFGYNLACPLPSDNSFVTSSLSPKMEISGAFDRSIRFSVPTHQRGAFDRAVGAIPPAFLGFPTAGEVFKSAAACKVRLQEFSVGQSRQVE